MNSDIIHSLSVLPACRRQVANLEVDTGARFKREVRSRMPSGTAAFVAIPQSDAAGSRARHRGQGRSYCGSYVSFTMLEKLFVAVSFIAAV